MFIPLRTDRAPRRSPVATGTIIVINMVAFLAGLVGTSAGAFDDAGAVAAWGRFDPGHFVWWQLITYQFIHGGIMHLVFNMLFLWVFGCAVEGRLTRVGFVIFYLVGGVFAALAHALVAPRSPVIGASGSIAAVTGAFLALFPRSRIHVLIIFFMIGVISIPSMWFIGFYFVLDILNQAFDFLGGARDVAYMAHIAGYVYGFGVAFALLATKVLTREEFDIFYLFTQFRRRSAFRAVSRQGPAGLWDSAQADTGKRIKKQAARAMRDQREDAERLAILKSQVERHLAGGDLPGAARAYVQVLAEAPDSAAAVLPEHQQIDLASQLYADGDYVDAARAYELVLRRYVHTPRGAEVRLMLGMIYARRLEQPERARALLTEARAGLADGNQAAMADRLLAELGA